MCLSYHLYDLLIILISYCIFVPYLTYFHNDLMVSQGEGLRADRKKF